MKIDSNMPIDEQITHYINKELDADSCLELENMLKKDAGLAKEKDLSEELIGSLRSEKVAIFSGIEPQLGDSRRNKILEACSSNNAKPPIPLFRKFKFTLVGAAAAVFLLFSAGLFEKENPTNQISPVPINAVKGWFSFRVTMPSGVYTFSAMDDVLTLTKFTASEDGDKDYLSESGIESGDRIVKINDQSLGNLSKQDYERKLREYLNEKEVVVFLQRQGLDVAPYKYSSYEK